MIGLLAFYILKTNTIKKNITDALGKHDKELLISVASQEKRNGLAFNISQKKNVSNYSATWFFLEEKLSIEVEISH